MEENSYRDNSGLIYGLLANLTNGCGKGAYGNFDNCQSALQQVVMDSINRNMSAIGGVKDTVVNGQNAIQSDLCHDTSVLGAAISGVGKCVTDAAAGINQNLFNGNQRISDTLCNSFQNTNSNITNGNQRLDDILGSSFQNTNAAISNGFMQSVLNDCKNTAEIMQGINQAANGLSHDLTHGFNDVEKDICKVGHDLTLQNCNNTHLLEGKIVDLVAQFKDNKINELSNEKTSLQSQLFNCLQTQAILDKLKCCDNHGHHGNGNSNNNSNDITIVLQQIQQLANGFNALSGQVNSLQSEVRKG